MNRSSGTDTKTEKIQRTLVEAKHREKTLQLENALARNAEMYLLVNLSDSSVELKAKGRTLRSFKIQHLEARLDKIAGTGQDLLEIKSIQKIDRLKLKPGEGEAATAEVAQKNLWGLDRMPQDYDLVCRNGMNLEFRGQPSEQSGTGSFKFLRKLYRRTLDRYRRRNAPEWNQQTIQIWLDENDSRLLFWSLPKQLKILVIPAVFPPDPQPNRNSAIQKLSKPGSSGSVGKGWADIAGERG